MWMVLERHSERFTRIEWRSPMLASITMFCVCRPEGYTGPALAFCIMKHETCRASTDKALVDQWQAGGKGRSELMAAVTAILQSSELLTFLEGLNATEEEPEPINSRGCWVMLCRTCLLTLPSSRARYVYLQQADAAFRFPCRCL